MSLITSNQLLDALIDAGVIDSDDRAKRVVIDLRAGDVPVIHIEKYGDDRLLSLVQTLEGIEIRREPAAVTS